MTATTRILLGSIAIFPTDPPETHSSVPRVLYMEFERDPQAASPSPPPCASSPTPAAADSPLPPPKPASIPAKLLSGLLTWELGISLSPSSANSVSASAYGGATATATPSLSVTRYSLDTWIPWPVTSPYALVQKFAYFNVYCTHLQSTKDPMQVGDHGSHGDAQASVEAMELEPNSNVKFLGTTGYTGLANEFGFDLDLSAWSEGLSGRLSGDRGLGKHKVRFWVQGVTQRGEVVPWEECPFVDVDVDSDDDG